MCTSSIKISAMLRHHCSQQVVPDSIIITDLIQKLIRPSHASLDTYSPLMNSNQNQQEMSTALPCLSTNQACALLLYLVQLVFFKPLGSENWDVRYCPSFAKKRTKTCFNDYQISPEIYYLPEWLRQKKLFPLYLLWSFHLNGQLDFLQGFNCGKPRLAKKAKMSCHPSFHKEENNKVPILRKDKWDISSHHIYSELAEDKSHFLSKP